MSIINANEGTELTDIFSILFHLQFLFVVPRTVGNVNRICIVSTHVCSAKYYALFSPVNEPVLPTFQLSRLRFNG
jgi:hypothetical protein